MSSRKKRYIVYLNKMRASMLIYTTNQKLLQYHSFKIHTCYDGL